MHRAEICERLTSGLAGWFQMLVCQDLQEQVGEDSVKVAALQILNAQNAYKPVASAQPANWGSNRRVDIALRGTSTKATGWYGVFELKWPKAANLPTTVHTARFDIVQDAVRVGFVKTTNMCANVILLGGTTESFQILFDTPHPQSVTSENRRIAFGQLFRRDLAVPRGVLTNAEMIQNFINFGGRIPPLLFNNWNGRLRTQLLARAEVKLGAETKGHIFAWQCTRTRGTIPPAPANAPAVPAAGN
jgi:hypothetical protein